MFWGALQRVNLVAGAMQITRVRTCSRSSLSLELQLTLTRLANLLLCLPKSSFRGQLLVFLVHLARRAPDLGEAALRKIFSKAI